MEEGETFTRYFFKKVMARGVLFKGLQDREGAVVTDTKGQLKIMEDFYSELFSEKKVDQVLMK